MSQVAMWVLRPRSCLPLLRHLRVPLVDVQHLLAGHLRAPHPCRLDVLGNLGTQLSCRPAMVLDLKTSRLFGGGQFAMKLAALPQRPAHVDPHTASMRPNAHAWSNPPTTFRWRVRLPHHDDVVSLHNRLGPRSNGWTPQHELS